MKNKDEILKIADVLLSVGRKDNKGKEIDTAYNDFEADVIFKYGCDRLNCATALVLQGYKKQISGKWIKTYEKSPRYVCSECNHLFNNKGYKFCPNCGSKMI